MYGSNTRCLYSRGSRNHCPSRRVHHTFPILKFRIRSTRKGGLVSGKPSLQRTQTTLRRSTGDGDLRAVLKRSQVWALAEVRPTCSRHPKSQVPSERHSEHVEPSSCLQTHVQVKQTSDGSCGIWDLECHQCRRTVLTSTTFTPDTNRPDMRPLLIQ